MHRLSLVAHHGLNRLAVREHAWLKRLNGVRMPDWEVGLFRLASRLGDGVFWYGLMLGPRKRWTLAGFLEVAARILARGLNPEFVIGPAEHDLLPELEQRTTAVHRPADCLDLLDLFRSARAYVGNDSGVSHLAAWKNLPCVVIFGPTDPAR